MIETVSLDRKRLGDEFLSKPLDFQSEAFFDKENLKEAAGVLSGRAVILIGIYGY